MNRLIVEISRILNVTEDEYHNFEYGIWVLVADICDFVPVLLISIYFHNLGYAILYIVIFSLLRQFTGGYHANTLLGCVILYSLTFLLYSVFFQLMMENIKLMIIVSIIISLSSLLIVPVVHMNHKLSEEEITNNKQSSVISIVILVLLNILMTFIDIKISITISYVLIVNSILAYLLYFINRRQSYDKRCNNR